MKSLILTITLAIGSISFASQQDCPYAKLRTQGSAGLMGANTAYVPAAYKNANSNSKAVAAKKPSTPVNNTQGAGDL